MNIKQELDNKLISALEEFKNAYLNLTEVLHETTNSGLEGDGHRFDSIAGIHYPFDASFDELEIPEWVDQSIDNLRSE